MLMFQRANPQRHWFAQRDPETFERTSRHTQISSARSGPERALVLLESARELERDLPQGPLASVQVRAPAQHLLARRPALSVRRLALAAQAVEPELPEQPGAEESQAAPPACFPEPEPERSPASGVLLLHLAFRRSVLVREQGSGPVLHQE